MSVPRRASLLAVLVVSVLVAACASSASPLPVSTDAWSIPFGSRPSSEPVNLVNCSNVTITNRTFANLGARVIAIRIENCTNVTIDAVDFDAVSEGVYALHSSGITVRNARYRDITGPSTRDGGNSGNFVQFNAVRGGLIEHNKGRGGDTEDIVSVFSSTGVTVRDNHFEGTDWASATGSGIALCDGGGSDNIAQGNSLLNPGQVGALVAGGTNCKLLDNIIYGAQRPLSNVGVYVWNQSDGACSGVEVRGNRVDWTSAAGNASGFWNAGNCETVTSANEWNASLNPLTLAVEL